MAATLVWKGDVETKLKGMAAKLTANRESLLEDIGRFVAASVRGNFYESRSPEGDPWPPRKSLRGDWPLLIKSGELLGSVGYAVRGEEEVAIGYGASHGRFHNEGTRWIPQRRFLGLREADDTLIHERVRRYVVEAAA